MIKENTKEVRNMNTTGGMVLEIDITPELRELILEAECRVKPEYREFYEQGIHEPITYMKQYIRDTMKQYYREFYFREPDIIPFPDVESLGRIIFGLWDTYKGAWSQKIIGKDRLMIKLLFRSNFMETEKRTQEVTKEFFSIVKQILNIGGENNENE